MRGSIGRLPGKPPFQILNLPTALAAGFYSPTVSSAINHVESLVYLFKNVLGADGMNLTAIALLGVLLSTAAEAATVTKVDTGKEMVILKLNKAELGRLEKGQDIMILSEGESVDARVEAISGKSAKIKILFGIENIAEGSRVEISTGSGRKKTAATETVTAPASDFSFGSGGAEHPWAGELHAPWVLNAPTPVNALDYHRSFNFMNPAQTMRVKKYAVVAGLDYVDGKATEKTGSARQILDIGSQAVGFTGVMHIHNGFRAGIGYEQKNVTFKSTTKNAGSASSESKFKTDTDVTTLLVSMPVADRYAFGAEYVQTNEKQKVGAGDRRSISSNILRPGVIYYARDVEAGLKYSPPISLREDGITYRDPRRLLLHIQKKSDSMRSVGGSLEHVHANGVDEDSVDYVNVRAGMGAHQLPWGGWGFMVNYRSKSYEDRDKSNVLTVPAYGLSILLDFNVDRMSSIGLDLAYTVADAKAKKSGLTDDSTSMKLQHLAVNLTYRYAL